MPDKREFVVSEIVNGEPDRLTLIGRCGDAPLPLEHTFDAILRFKPRNYPEGYAEDDILVGWSEAALRIDHIDAYKRDWPQLGEGMTAAITVSGEGLDRLSPGVVLGMKGSRHIGGG